MVARHSKIQAVHALETEAEDAANTGHYVAAETLLRRGLKLLESMDQPSELDLALLLHSLAHVLEAQQKLTEAEFYRSQAANCLSAIAINRAHKTIDIPRQA
jgi:hypothetical protein